MKYGRLKTLIRDMKELDYKRKRFKELGSTYADLLTRCLDESQDMEKRYSGEANWWLSKYKLKLRMFLVLRRLVQIGNSLVIDSECCRCALFQLWLTSFSS